PFPTRRDKARATTSGPKRTAARRVASLFGSGVVAPRSSRQVGTGDAPSSRLARTEKRRNKRGRIYEMEYLAGGALQRQRTDPTGVVFFDPPVAVDDRALLFAVKLVIHAVPGNRLDQPAFFAVKIGVFVPAGRIEEKVAHATRRFGRQLISGKLEREFVSAVKQDEGVVTALKQLPHVAITGAPTCRRDAPVRCLADIFVTRREGQIPGEVLEFTEAAPMQVGNVRIDSGDLRAGGIGPLEQGDAVPMNFKSG